MADAPVASGKPGGCHLGPAAAWLLVFLLFAVYFFSFIDRINLGLLVEPSRAEFLLTDTQIGLLQGLAFALFYTICGLPIGWAVDRFARVPIAAFGTALWNAMTALCGLARSFVHLFLARVGMGVGEATLPPLIVVAAICFALAARAIRTPERQRRLSLYGAPA
ncbi:MAG: MFS transporter [Pontixanthobacter sp.]